MPGLNDPERLAQLIASFEEAGLALVAELRAHGSEETVREGHLASINVCAAMGLMAEELGLRQP